MKIIESHEVIIEKHPYYESLNKKLIEESKEFLFVKNLICDDGAPTNIKALQTHNDIESPTLSLITKWIVSLMQGKYNASYTINDRWMTKYNKGDYTLSHSHQPFAFAFNYFILFSFFIFLNIKSKRV